MSQEVTVLTIVDVKAAIAANSLVGNIYFIDNLRTEGSTGGGTDHLNSMANSSHWSTGAQAYQPLFNWLVYPLVGLSPALPRDYRKIQTQKAKENLVRLFKGLRAEQTATKSNTKESNAKAETAAKSASATSSSKLSLASVPDFVSTKVRNQSGKLHHLGAFLMNPRGGFVNEGAIDPDDMDYITPKITNITGEAVDKGIIYPAQYGTPRAVDDGWYWSATVSSFAPGTYSYTLHITVYNPTYSKEKGLVWEPVKFTHDLKLTVVSKPMVNGFTEAGLGYLPIPM